MCQTLSVGRWSVWCWWSRLCVWLLPSSSTDNEYPREPHTHTVMSHVKCLICVWVVHLSCLVLDIQYVCSLLLKCPLSRWIRDLESSTGNGVSEITSNVSSGTLNLTNLYCIILYCNSSRSRPWNLTRDVGLWFRPKVDSYSGTAWEDCRRNDPQCVEWDVKPYRYYCSTTCIASRLPDNLPAFVWLDFDSASLHLLDPYQKPLHYLEPCSGRCVWHKSVWLLLLAVSKRGPWEQSSSDGVVRG